MHRFSLHFTVFPYFFLRAMNIVCSILQCGLQQLVLLTSFTSVFLTPHSSVVWSHINYVTHWLGFFLCGGLMKFVLCTNVCVWHDEPRNSETARVAFGSNLIVLVFFCLLMRLQDFSFVAKLAELTKICCFEFQQRFKRGRQRNNKMGPGKQIKLSSEGGVEQKRPSRRIIKSLVVCFVGAYYFRIFSKCLPNLIYLILDK